MRDANRVKVVIRGRTYQLMGEDADHTRRLARHIDETMARFSEGMVATDNYQLAILTALHLADELFAERGQFHSFRSQVGASADRILDLLEGCLTPDEIDDENTAGQGEATRSGT